MLPEYLIEEWKSAVKISEENLHSDCPLIEDALIVEVDRYIKELEAKIVELGGQNV